jgi:lipid A 3-O-deacylase
MKTQRVAAMAAALAALSCNAHAMDLTPRGAFVIGGVTAHRTDSLSAGLVWPWTWRREAGGGELTGLTEAYVSYWKARAVPGLHSTFTQVGVVPLVRYRFSQQRLDWFAEAGIGISLMDRLYRTPDKQFSTSFNFVDVAGVGRSFGAQRQHELGLRLVHISNAGIKKPNPGENFLQLRYAVLF